MFTGGTIWILTRGQMKQPKAGQVLWMDVIPSYHLRETIYVGESNQKPGFLNGVKWISQPSTVFPPTWSLHDPLKWVNGLICLDNDHIC